MVTLSFKVSESEKDYANDIIEDFQKTSSKNKSESLIEILRIYERSTIEDKTSEAFVPPNVKDVLKNIDCEFLKFYEQDFYCLEKVASTKKLVILEGSPLLVQDMCNACGYYREKKRIQKIQDLRQKEYIKRLERFMKGLMRITEKGFITDIQFCICDVLEGDLGFSRDGRTLKCPLENNEIVWIQEVCQTRLNPDKGTPPCQYFASLERLVQITKDDWEKENLTLPQLPDFDLDQELDQEFDLDQSEPKFVEPDFQVQPDEEQNGGEN